MGPGNAPCLAAPSPGQVDNSLDSKFSFAKSLTVSFVGNSPLGITCDNTAPPSKALLINMSGVPFEGGNFNSGEVIEQTQTSNAAAITSVCV